MRLPFGQRTLRGIFSGEAPTGGGGCGTDWKPPGYLYKDTDEIYIRPGLYPPAGLRSFPMGQYENPIAQFDWELTEALAVDVDATYKAGVTSGMVGGAKVNSSWYSLWMTSQGIILVLPYIRIDAIAYSDPSTTINPASQADGTTAENGFLAANDAWNNYRLQKISWDVYGGRIFTIADCVSGTPDQIIITGDQTTYLAAEDWLQLCPPAGQDCVYLGDIWIDASGNLGNINCEEWKFQWADYVGISANKATSASLANTNMYAAYSPTAKTLQGFLYFVAAAANYGVIAVLYAGTSGTDRVHYYRNSNATVHATERKSDRLTISPRAICQIRNYFAQYSNASWTEVAIDTTGQITISAWEL